MDGWVGGGMLTLLASQGHSGLGTFFSPPDNDDGDDEDNDDDDVDSDDDDGDGEDLLCRPSFRLI